MSATDRQTDSLAAHEACIRDFVETHMVDECGLLVSYLNADTLRPWTKDQLADFDRASFTHAHTPDISAYFAYEDSLMATGEYATAEILRFAATGDPAALAAAAHPVYALLRVLFEGEHFEKGFLPKPFGGMRRAKYSHELSPDQYIKTVVALLAWRPWAGPAAVRTINDYLVAMADYFVARDFKHPRRESMVVTLENRPHAMTIYLPLLMLAAQITGDDAYRGHLHRFDAILDDLVAGNYQVNFNLLSLWIEGFTVAADAGWEDDRLPAICRRLWADHAALVDDDGYGREPHAPELRTSRVLRLPSVAPLVERWCPDLEVRPLARRVLGALTDPRRMRYVNDPDERTIPPRRAYLARSICETSVSSWLLAYWRFHGDPS